MIEEAKLTEVIRKIKRGKISVSYGARLLGLSLLDFIRILRERGMKPYKAFKEDLEFFSLEEEVRENEEERTQTK